MFEYIRSGRQNIFELKKSEYIQGSNIFEQKDLYTTCYIGYIGGRMAKKTQTQFQMAVEEFKKELETGLLDEKYVTPVRIEYKYDEEKDEDYAVLTDASDEQIIITHPKALRQFFYYYRGDLEKRGLTIKKIFDMTPEQRTELINELLRTKPKSFKLQIDPKTHEVIFVRSPKFEQVSWADVFEVVTKAIQKAFNSRETEFIGRGRNNWLFKIPVDHEWMDFWVGVYAGSNVGFAKRKSILISIHARTIKELRGMEAPCFNWCTFAATARWFGWDTSHIRAKLPKVKDLTTRAIHLTGQKKQKLDVKILADEFKKKMVAVQESLKELDKYIHYALTEDDLNAIIDAYKEAYHLPKYVIEDVKQLVKEPTVFGLSNAFSFFRTHCKYKRVKAPREEADLTRRLDHIAGELIVLAPLIKTIKERFGKITKEILFNPPKTNRKNNA